MILLLVFLSCVRDSSALTSSTMTFSSLVFLEAFAGVAAAVAAAVGVVAATFAALEA